MEWKIGSVKIPNQVVSAPMAGVSDKGYRLLARGMGCGLVFTEMVSDKALVYLNRRTYQILDIQGELPPVAVQIFGSEPEVMAQAAQLVEKAGATLIDINMGCPAPKIVKNGEGVALMRDLSLAAAIIKEVIGAVSVPVTVKMRKGWDESSINVIELAQAAEKAGAAAVTVHGRTRSQFYSGQADWEIIRQVREAVAIPVIGNGDIWKPEDALRMLETTGCQGVMIGRGSLGNPWIFQRTVHYLATGEVLPAPSVTEKIQMALRHLCFVVEDKGEKVAVKEMRKNIAWYLKGLRDGARVREHINSLDTEAQIREALLAYEKRLLEMVV